MKGSKSWSNLLLVKVVRPCSQFRILREYNCKFDCLVCEMFSYRKLKPSSHLTIPFLLNVLFDVLLFLWYRF